MQSQNPTLIKLSDINVSWDNRRVLSDINLTVNRGDFLAITGPNGGGKTTLLRVILKLLHPSSGHVEYFENGVCVDKLPIGYLPQKNKIDSHFPITVEQVVTYGLLGKKGIDKETIAKRVKQSLELMELTEKRNAAIGDLSGGQLQRALLGRALISEPHILVLDEPLSYLDKHFEHHLYDILAEIAPSTTIILVSHEMSRIGSMANRHIIINNRLEECSAGHHYFTLDCPCPAPKHQ